MSCCHTPEATWQPDPASSTYSRLHRWHHTGRGMSISELREIGHDLERLLEDVLEDCFTETHRDRPITREDFEFLHHNDLFRLLLRTLSEFANQEGRCDGREATPGIGAVTAPTRRRGTTIRARPARRPASWTTNVSPRTIAANVVNPKKGAAGFWAG